MFEPNFLIIGAQKAASTWLSSCLSQHPQVFMVHGTYFFDNPTNFAKGVTWYRRFFDGAAGKQAIGEKTPSYLWGEKFAGGAAQDVPARVRQVIPHAKIVIILRNPVARAVSHFNHAIRSGKVSPFVDIDRALTTPEFAATRGLGILQGGLYYRHIRRWLDYFPREQMHVLIMEQEVVQRPHDCLAGACGFLGIDTSFPFPDVHEKVNRKLSKAELIVKYYIPALRKPLKRILRRMPQESFRPGPRTMAQLAEYYHEENANLSRLLGINLSCWQQSPASERENQASATAEFNRVGRNPNDAQAQTIDRVA
jgi:hypothetical protein